MDLARQQLESSLSYNLPRQGSDHSWAPSKLFILGSYCMTSVFLNLNPRNFLLISTLISIVVTIQSLSHVWLFETPWIAASRDSLFSISWSLLPLTSIEIVMPSNHLILCHPLLLLPSIFPSIRVFFQWVSSLHQVAKVLELHLQRQIFQWILRVDFPLDWLVWHPCCLKSLLQHLKSLLRRQVRGPGIPISSRIFHSLLW